MTGICDAPGCLRAPTRGGLCGGHRSQKNRGQAFRPLRKRNKVRQPCTISGCSREERAKGLCAAHYSRRYRGVADDARPIRSREPLRAWMVNPRLPPDVVEALESLMERAKLTRSGAIREALKAWVRWLDAQPRKWAR